MPTTVIHGSCPGGGWPPSTRKREPIGGRPPHSRASRLVDHRDRWRADVVRRAEGAAGEHRDAEGLEVAVAGDVGIDLQRGAARRPAPSSSADRDARPGWMFESGTAVVTAADYHARRGAQLVEDLEVDAQRVGRR